MRKNLANLASKDTVCKVWVIFTDRKPPAAAVSKRAQNRRLRAGVRAPVAEDMPVSQKYIADVERLGGRCANVFKWANAASFVVPSQNLAGLARQPYVRELILVRTFGEKKFSVPFGGLRKSGLTAADSVYGGAYSQLSICNVPPAHRYIRKMAGKAPGEGIFIGVFDSGFRLRHRCFNALLNTQRVVADSDFVDKDGSVEDPDSVAGDPNHPYYRNDIHGAQTLSLMGGFDSLRFTGDAYGGRFVLARTEDTRNMPTGGEIESHTEEDNWAAAMVWAESLGVDIVSSSLGYGTDFTPPETSYTYQDMDGMTTIVSKAAREAVRFGVIVVNSMGNEGARNGTLLAPADVDGVVSVGAIDSDLRIGSFSSGGPTADGRIKPDCVAPGVSVTLPSVYEAGNGYTLGSGTSFAAPLAAGICGLILQVNSGDSAAAIRERLYSSCFFVPGQNAADNTYGRGVPDALLACLPYNQTYITVADSFGHSVAGATAAAGTGYPVGSSDSTGYAIITLSGSFPETLAVTHDSYFPAQIIIESRHSREKVEMAARYVLSVFLRDTLARPVAGKIFWKAQGAGAFASVQTDSSGYVLLTTIPSSAIDLYGAAHGYYASTHEVIQLAERIANSITVTVRPRPPSQFVIYPNVINIAGKRQQLTMEFTSLPDDPRYYSQMAYLMIRSVDGTLVWQKTMLLEENKPTPPLHWPESGKTVAPGVYYFIVKYGGKAYKQKFLVIG